MPTTHRAAIISAAIYAGVSVAASGTFLLVTVLTGEYGWVARVGGSIWVFLLSMIILMPVVIPRVKRKVAG
jgi:hypothetical protein